MSSIITIYCGTAPSSEPKEATKVDTEVETKVVSTKTRKRSNTNTNK